MYQIILASGSEGRRELFDRDFSGQFITVASDISEDGFDHLPAPQLVEHLAQLKSQALLSRYPNKIICAFDTMVSCQHQILGKPKSLEEAKIMLQTLARHTQSVWSGYSIRLGDQNFSGSVEAKLQLNLNDEEIETYIHNNPVQKFAGAYAIQKSDTRATIISGDRDTIIGAPMSIVRKIIQDLQS